MKAELWERAKELGRQAIGGTRIPTGISELDELLGNAPYGPCGFHAPSVVLLSGPVGVGKSTLLHQMTAIFGILHLLFGDTNTPVSVIKMVADNVLTAPENLLVVDHANYMTAKDVTDLSADNRLVILVMHSVKVPSEWIHTVSTHLHMTKQKAAMTIECDKNRFGATGSIVRLAVSSVWKRK